MVATVSDREFSERVLQSRYPVLVSFRSAGCASSLALGPLVERVASKYEGRIATFAVEADRSAAISRQMRVTRLPVTMMISDGKVVDFIGGMTDEKNLSEMIERRLEPVLHVGEGNFDLEVLESRIPALVHFGASWCSSSERLMPAIREIGERFAKVVKVTRVEFSPANAQLCSRHGVIRVPTTALFVGGRMEDQIFGHTSVDNISNMITPFLL
jgi:thioredoxin 1